MSRLIRSARATAVGVACTCIAFVAGAGNVYQLHNHPDGNARPPAYGLRLDGLFDTANEFDRYTFSFDHDSNTSVFMSYNGAGTVHIWGRAYGGLDIGQTWKANTQGYVDIDFTYNFVSAVPGDDDLWDTGLSGTSAGTLVWKPGTAEETFTMANLFEGSDSFRFGDTANDQGYRGFVGLSGWGGLTHNGDYLGANSHWLFTAVMIPLPPAVWMGLAGLAGAAWYRRRATAPRRA